ncbi:MAG: TonB-dependent receptor [Acidobacteria bacterium]|nr:TonB-dependent receptor [Acidobacteriota bacterium]
MRKFFTSLTLALLLAFGSGQAVKAQSAGATTSSLTGSVIDEQGNTIPGAIISVKNLQTNFVREIRAQEDGSYLVTQLNPGNYELTISADGFNTQTTRLDLVLGSTSLVNFSMKIGTTSDIIEVIASATIDEGKTESSNNIDRGNIDSLPINRRNFLDFSLTTPRAVTDRTPQQGITVSSMLAFNGQNARFNNITTDGLDNNEPVGGSVRSNFSQDSVQEFQVVSDSFSAEFGRATAGIVNIVTRGGGNDFHGSSFLFLRNEAIAARDAFAAIDPEFKQYQFGSLLSGPIKKDKAFFFLSFERLSVKQNNIVTINDQSVDAARRQGFFLRNGPVPVGQANTSILARTDLRLTPNDTLWVRYNYGGSFNGSIEPFGGLIGETNGGVQEAAENALAANNTYINVGLNLVNETRILLSERDLDISTIGNDPQVQLFAPEGRIVFGRSSFLPQFRELDTGQFVNNTSLSKGRHQIKFGIDLKYLTFTAPLSFFATGLSVFAPLDLSALTGTTTVLSGLQAFDPQSRTPSQRATLMTLSQTLPQQVQGFPSNVPLADLAFPSFIAQGFSDLFVQSVPGRYYSTFVQDDIKIKSNLTLKLGLRYDLTRISFMPSNDGNFSPRVGFAYQPKRLPNARIYGSYGIFVGTPIYAIPFTLELLKRKQIQVLVTPFPFSVLTFALPGHGLPESPKIPDGVPFIPQLSQDLVYDKNVRSSYTQQVNFGIDYTYKKSNISLSYAFVRGLKFLSNRNINPVVRPTPGNPVASSISGRVDTTQGDLFEFESAFDSYYNAFTLSYKQKVTGRFNIFAHYTFAKAIDNFVDFRIDVNQFNDSLKPALERSLSVQDLRSRFVLSGSVDIGYGKSKLLRDFRLSTIVNAESGRPYNITAGADLNLSGDFPPSDRPLGLGRNTGISPGFFGVDLRLERKITVKERVQVQGFLEVFNLFNRVNISEIDGIFPADAQGNFNLPKKDGSRFIAPPERFRSAFAPRQVQLGFRFSF